MGDIVNFTPATQSNSAAVSGAGADIISFPIRTATSQKGMVDVYSCSEGVGLDACIPTELARLVMIDGGAVIFHSGSPSHGMVLLDLRTTATTAERMIAILQDVGVRIVREAA